jgi:hypothetical protein
MENRTDLEATLLFHPLFTLSLLFHTYFVPCSAMDTTDEL